MRNLLGPLSDIVQNPLVTDIAVTSNGRIWADYGNGMVEKTLESGSLTAPMVRDFAIQLCASLGKRLDDACPIADASSPEGLRVHAVLSPIVSRGASISIRLPHHHLATLDELAKRRMFPQEWKPLLEAIVASKQSVLICGGTGTGKTTLVKALLAAVPASERVVLVEEIRELEHNVHHNSESLVVRESNVEGAGEITLSDLIRATVRMRPDRIVLGECRGEEVADLMRALNSGHKGSIATVHADSIERVPARICALGLLAGIDIPAMSMLAAGAFDVVLHVERTEKSRHIAQIGTLSVDSNGRLQGQVLTRWDGHGEAQYADGFMTWYESFRQGLAQYHPSPSEIQTFSNDNDTEEISDSTIEFARVVQGGTHGIHGV